MSKIKPVVNITWRYLSFCSKAYTMHTLYHHLCLSSSVLLMCNLFFRTKHQSVVKLCLLQALFYTKIEKPSYKTPKENLDGMSGELVLWSLTS